MYAKNAWNKYEDNQYKDVMDFNEGYKAFLSSSKTERACVKESVKKLVFKIFKIYRA